MSPLSAFTAIFSVIVICLTISNIATIWYKVKILEKSKDINEYEEVVKPKEKSKIKKIILDPEEEIEQQLY